MAIANRSMSRPRSAFQRHIWRRPTAVLPAHGRKLGDATGAGTDETHGPPMTLDLLQEMESTGDPAGHMAYQQMPGHVERIPPILVCSLPLPAVKALGERQARPDLCATHLPCGTPHQMEAEMVCEHAESQFDIPSPRRQAHDLTGGQGQGMEDSGQRAVPLALGADEAHGGAGLGVPRGSHPHTGIAEAILTAHDLLNGEGRGSDVTAHPEEASGGEFVTPCTGKRAAITEQKGSGEQTIQHGTRVDGAGLAPRARDPDAASAGDGYHRGPRGVRANASHGRWASRAREARSV